MGLPVRRGRPVRPDHHRRTTGSSACPEGTDDKPYYFPDDITDKSIEWLHRVRAQDATKPWFMFYSTGCAHAPHHVPTEWADKYKGTVRRRLGQAARAHASSARSSWASSRRTPSSRSGPDAFPAWDSLDDDAKRLYVRQAEVYAGYQENADWNVGRLIDAVDEMGDLDNTLIIYIWGDNGASLEGTITGSFNELTFLNGLVLDPEQQLKLIEEYGGLEALGGDHTAPHIAAAWAHAFNTPFQWGKQTASHLGGTRDPMVMSWPSRVKPDAAPRAQFTHVIDVGPTILEAAGIPEPKTVDGIAQEPMDGTSFLYSFDERERARAAHHPVLRDVRQPRACTRTAGGRRRDRTGCRGTCRPRPSRSSARTPTGTPTGTSAGSCTT